MGEAAFRFLGYKFTRMDHLSVEEKTLGLAKVIIFGILLWN